MPMIINCDIQHINTTCMLSVAQIVISQNNTALRPYKFAMYYKYTTEINHNCYFSYNHFKLYTVKSAHRPNIYI